MGSVSMLNLESYQIIILSGIFAVWIFWVVQFVDVLRRRFADSTIKLIWVLVVLFGQALGALVYYIVGKKQGTLPRKPGAA
jgi:hypothetical protein